MTRLLATRVRRGTALAASLAGAALLAAWRPPVFHLHLVKSVPAANATVESTPASIELWFSQKPELGVTTVKVTGPGSVAVPLAPLTPGDSSRVVAAVKGPMANGAYTVAWRAMAKDGHVARGSFAFTVRAGAEE